MQRVRRARALRGFEAHTLMPSTQGVKYPKLRSRHVLTLRYKQLQAERDYWQSQRGRVGIDLPRVQAKIERYIMECEVALDTLRYALNDVI